ncbi:unnamed protein product [Alopecurus aequalis]
MAEAAHDGPPRPPPPGCIQDAPAGRENDLDVIELARFAVTEHNTELVKVRHQVVAGSMHYFTIEVKEGGNKRLYQAKVWEMPWENFKQLQEFKPAA